MSTTHDATLLMSEFVTHNVRRYVVSKPHGFKFQSGQGVELAINNNEWKNEARPFTPTNLDADLVLEFTIKTYPSHKSVTRELPNLSPGTKLLVSEPFGTIQYQGPGVFLAGGAGITPFISILRGLASSNEIKAITLIFSNKTSADVIYEKELRHYLNDRCILTCTSEKATGYENRHIDKAFLEEKIKDFDQPFYVCGPPGFMESVTKALKQLGAKPESLIFEQ